MAVIPTRAWPDAGVTSTEALMAPFLIDNDALMRAVASDQTVLQPMLDGMAQQGLIGIAVWPEVLRHIFSFDQNGPPIVSPSQVQGQTIFTIGSTLQNQIWQTLGATPTNEFPPDPLVENGTARGAEAGLWLYNLYGGPTTITADLTIYPKYQTLVAEDAAWSRLSADQQQVIRNAAVTARDAFIAQVPHDTDLVKEFCQSGQRAVLAGSANVEAFRQAAQPIYDQMRKDPFTASALDAIQALKDATPPGPAAEACDPAPQATAPPVASAGPIGLVPDGTYKQSVTKEQLIARGANETDATNNAGDWTWTFDGTHGSWVLDHPSGQHEVCDVTYAAVGDHVQMSMGCGGEMDFRWTLDGDQLNVTIVGPGTAYDVTANQAILGGPWTKVE
jgi:TRAP-type C4-dicarboxylate transport system substrate-binding protein